MTPARSRDHSKVLAICTGVDEELQQIRDLLDVFVDATHYFPSVPQVVGDVETLAERTEGWAAALQLAALSLQDRTDTAAAVAAFAGHDRFIGRCPVTGPRSGNPCRAR